MSDLASRAINIFEALFSDQEKVELEEGSYRIGTTRGGLRCITVDGIFYIEQNPDKGSRWAKQAQAGHQIMWGLKGRVYVLQVVDGVFKKLR